MTPRAFVNRTNGSGAHGCWAHCGSTDAAGARRCCVLLGAELGDGRGSRSRRSRNAQPQERAGSELSCSRAGVTQGTPRCACPRPRPVGFHAYRNYRGRSYAGLVEHRVQHPAISPRTPASPPTPRGAHCASRQPGHTSSRCHQRASPSVSPGQKVARLAPCRCREPRRAPIVRRVSWASAPDRVRRDQRRRMVRERQDRQASEWPWRGYGRRPPAPPPLWPRAWRDR